MFNSRKLAKLVIDYSLGVSKGESIGIVGHAVAAPLIRELYKCIFSRGGHPTLRANLDGLDELFYTHTDNEQLTNVSKFALYLYENVDRLIRIHAETNVKRLSNVPPERIKKRAASQKEIREAIAAHAYPGGSSLIPYPTQAFAQEAEMSLFEYEKFVERACFLNKRNPAEEWKKLSSMQERIVKKLNQAEIMRFTSDDYTSLTVNVKGRRWINCDGKLNMPDGEVFTGPIENSADGKIKFSYPKIYKGREMDGICLDFKEGRVIYASAEKGEDLLNELIKADRGASRVGEIAIGTNKYINRFTKNILFDEKMGHCIHLALGGSIAISGGINKSAIHCDLLKDMRSGEIYADGELIYEKGEFVKEFMI